MPQDENRLSLLRTMVKRQEEREEPAAPTETRSWIFANGGMRDAPNRAKDVLRESLASDVDAFLAAGGHIEQVPVLDKFEMSGHVGYEILYGSKEGRRYRGGARSHS